MFKKILLGVMSAVLSFALCGCDFFTADTAELLTPPSLPGDLKYISQAVSESAGKEYILKFASRGSYRSAIVLKDIDGDGTDEAFAFYSITEGDVVSMHINAVYKKDKEWVSAGEQHLVAAGVDKIEFSDLDNDGVLDILVGWEIYGASEKQLAVYSFDKNSITQRFIQKYSDFAVCNLDENEREEVLIIDFNATEVRNTATLFIIDNENAVQLGSCKLDSKVQSIGEPKVSHLSSGKEAVYIDSVKGVGAITEVLIYEKGQLLNNLYDKELMETNKTLRSVSFTTTDINKDGILEIPVQQEVPSVSSSELAEKLYLTNWCTFNGEVLTNQMTTMINVLDGYYYIIPQNLVENIAVLKDTDKRIREIYSYDKENMTVGESLIYFGAVNKQRLEKGEADIGGFTEIGNDGESVFVVGLSQKAKEMGFSIDSIKANFVVYAKE